MTSDDIRDLAYPLQWPAGYRRTKSHLRERALFKRDRPLGAAIRAVTDECQRLGARYPIISSNLAVRLDGLPRAGQGDGDSVGDPGAALYFLLRERGKDEQRVIACDRWNRVRDNIYAIAKTIEAMRGLERWGCSEILQRSMQAFAALPPSAIDWRIVLDVSDDADLLTVKSAYRKLAAEHHPDRGGDPAQMAKLNAAWEYAQRDLGHGGHPR
jgi:hypothetical protein